MNFPVGISIHYYAQWKKPESQPPSAIRGTSYVEQGTGISINLAFRQARDRRHEFMTVEHLLLALLDNPAAVEVLRACGANLDSLKRELQTFIRDNTPVLAPGTRVKPSRLWGSSGCCNGRCCTSSPLATAKSPAQMCWWRCSANRESQAVYLLKQQEVSRLDVVNFIAHGISKIADDRRASRR